jgi:hypothetical protein
MVKCSGGEKSASSCNVKSGKFSKDYRNRELLIPISSLFTVPKIYENVLYYPGFYGT